MNKSLAARLSVLLLAPFAKSAEAPPLDARRASRPSAAFMDRPTTYYASYLSLTPKFGFYDYGDELRTPPAGSAPAPHRCTPC